MSDDDILIAAEGLLVKIHVITGWVIPEGDLMMELVNQFIKKMQEDYSTVNVEEVEFAFRKYGTTVKDWGKAVNLSLIDEVMLPYLQARKVVSNVEEQESLREIEGPKESLEDESMQQWLDDVSRIVVSENKPPHQQVLPPMLYDWLDRTERLQLDKAQKILYMDAAAKIISGLNELPEMEKVKRLAKKLALNDYIMKNYARISTSNG